MMIPSRSVFLLASVSLMTACATSDRYKMTSPEAIEGKTWVLKSLNGEPPIDNRRVTLRFENTMDTGGKVMGKGPCNRYSGNYREQKGMLEFDALAAGRMACTEPVLKQERAFLADFPKVNKLASNSNGVILRGEDGDYLQFVSESASVNGEVKSTTGSFPADSVVKIQLQDISNPDEPRNIIGESKIELKYEMGAPLQYSVAYSPSLVRPDHMYAMFVQVRHNGRVISQSAIKKIVELKGSETFQY